MEKKAVARKGTKPRMARVHVYKERARMGKAAAEYVIARIADVLRTKEKVNIVFAAAPSQNEFLDCLTRSNAVPWQKVVGFHMDEYIGLPKDSDQFFSLFLTNRLFSKVPMSRVHILDAHAADPEKECARYEALLRRHPVDIACVGIGENGHIAFNDPHVADFNDRKLVRIVELDMPCRQQQVNDGCFPTIADVPPTALTLTIPALMSATYVSCVVPSERKARAVANALTGEIRESVPASILRTHPHIEFFFDRAAASLLRK